MLVPIALADVADGDDDAAQFAGDADRLVTLEDTGVDAALDHGASAFDFLKMDLEQMDALARREQVLLQHVTLGLEYVELQQPSRQRLIGIFASRGNGTASLCSAISTNAAAVGFGGSILRISQCSLCCCRPGAIFLGMQSHSLTDFTAAEKLQEIAREIALRRSLYRIKIARKQMKVEEAARRIAIMLAIARDYGGHGDEQS
jgi:hypothetical protein